MLLTKINPNQAAFLIDQNLHITTHEQRPGPPERLSGMTVGIIDMTQDAPHNGEMHPDGDELLYVITGSVRITCESSPDQFTDLLPGEACVVPKGEWHKVALLEPTRLMHITPGPGGDHRPLDAG